MRMVFSTQFLSVSSLVGRRFFGEVVGLRVLLVALHQHALLPPEVTSMRSKSVRSKWCGGAP